MDFEGVFQHPGKKINPDGKESGFFDYTFNMFSTDFPGGLKCVGK